MSKYGHYHWDTSALEIRIIKEALKDIKRLTKTK